MQQNEAATVAVAETEAVTETVGVGVVEAVAVGVAEAVGVRVAEAVKESAAANLHTHFFPVPHSCFKSETKYVILSHPSNVDLYRSVSIGVLLQL